jgi:hypothetical protein
MHHPIRPRHWPSYADNVPNGHLPRSRPAISTLKRRQFLQAAGLGIAHTLAYSQHKKKWLIEEGEDTENALANNKSDC